MIKKLLLGIFFIFIVIQATFAQEIFRVTSVSFDTANSLIFLTSPDNTTEAIMKNVKLTKLQNPKRVYFDINSAVLTAAPQNWYFNSGGIKQVKVNQFSSNPNKIRVVLYLDEKFDQSKITFLRVNNNIVIKFKDGFKGTDYYQTTYRDEKSTSSDFYQNLAISNEEIEKVKSATINVTQDKVLDQIQQAFNTIAVTDVKQAAANQKIEAIKKELRLKSKYYMNSISVKSNGFLISGFGVVGIEKPMYLTNPARVVFDIPNSIVNPDLKNKEFCVGKDSIKISQMEANKTRIVVTSNELEKYFPIFSSDGQSIFFVNTDSIDPDALFTKTTDAVSYLVKKIGSQYGASTEEFVINFNSPVVHSIKKDSSKLTINFYNALRYNDKTFRSVVAPTAMSDMKIDLLPKVGLKLTFPLEKTYLVNSYMSADGKSVKVVVKGLKSKLTPPIVKNAVVVPRCKGKKSVVLDAGHGGSDYGAIRCGINEKDINLDVAKRVQAILQSKGANVYMTRERDEFISLQDRTIITANKCPEIFVSVHVNSSAKPEVTGIETHYYHDDSVELAHTVHSCLASCINSKDRGLFRSRFYVINHVTIPAILVEIGFISNDNERAELVSEQRKQQTAEAIAEGILKYLNGK